MWSPRTSGSCSASCGGGGATTAAIKKLKAALSAMFATALEDGQVRSHPVKGVRVPLAADDMRDEEREIRR